jgi:orotidine-5'-phosphate decarboxylase
MVETKAEKKNHLCIGLDIYPELLPSYITFKKDFVEYFIEGVIESTYELVDAYKFNMAFFESMGSYGLKILENILPKIPKQIIKICDAKRGDIGSSSRMYAKGIYEHFRFDAVTLNPLLGYDSLEPFFRYINKTNYVLALTSNPGASEFQKLKLGNGKTLFEEVLAKIKKWNAKHKNLGIVFGATQKSGFSVLDENFSDIPLLIPGIGHQGGNLKSVISHLKKKDFKNFLISSSREVLYSNLNGDFRKCIFNNANQLNQQIKELYYQ